MSSQHLKITEDKPSDISTVYCYYTDEEKARTPQYIGYKNQIKHCEHYSCFSGDYPLGKEREFIEKINSENPGKFKSFHISWSNSD